MPPPTPLSNKLEIDALRAFIKLLVEWCDDHAQSAHGVRDGAPTPVPEPVP